MALESKAVQQPARPAFQCIKRVCAVKILSLDYDRDLIQPEGPYSAFTTERSLLDMKAEPGGYYVRYEDGYESYSPAAVFEAGYREIPELPRRLPPHLCGAPNTDITILADNRDMSGASHVYQLWHGEIFLGEVRFQDGPIAENGVNGVMIEDLLAIALDRLEGFNEGPYRCRENSLAITKIEEALHRLRDRTEARQRRGVEWTSKL